jgi:hypothetical protein
MAERHTPESFTVGEWVEFHGAEGIRKFQVTAINEYEVTIRAFGKPMVFAPRHSDGKLVKAGSPDYEAALTTIVKLPSAPERTTSRWKDIRDFLNGMFWAP